MSHEFPFTFDKIRAHFEEVARQGYRVIRCRDYVDYKRSGATDKVLINRIDVDVSPKKALRLAEMFTALGMPATFFVRLHANEYNPFAFEPYRCFKAIRDAGHELGYHSEIVDQSVIWNESAEACLRRDLEIMCRMFDTPVVGVASHGGMTGLNNLDFWKDRQPAEFGLLYEAYDKLPTFNLFQESFYVSDSEWTRWKCYRNGKLVPDDRRSLSEHARDNHRVLYSLIHPETYYDNHFYE